MRKKSSYFFKFYCQKFRLNEFTNYKSISDYKGLLKND